MNNTRINMPNMTSLNLSLKILKVGGGVIRIRKSKKKTTQWPKGKFQKDKQRSTKYTH